MATQVGRGSLSLHAVRGSIPAPRLALSPPFSSTVASPVLRAMYGVETCVERDIPVSLLVFWPVAQYPGSKTRLVLWPRQLAPSRPLLPNKRRLLFLTTSLRRSVIFLSAWNPCRKSSLLSLVGGLLFEKWQTCWSAWERCSLATLVLKYICDAGPWKSRGRG